MVDKGSRHASGWVALAVVPGMTTDQETGTSCAKESATNPPSHLTSPWIHHPAPPHPRPVASAPAKLAVAHGCCF